MSSSVFIKVNAAGRSLQELTIPEGAGRSGRPLRFKLPANSRVEMLDPLTGLGPEQIQVKRVGQALHVAFKGSDLAAPDLVLEDFFKGKDEDRSRLLGKTQGNDTQDYVPADSSTGQVSELAEGGRGSTYTLKDAAHAVVEGGAAGAATGTQAAGAAGTGGGLGLGGTLGVVAGVVVVAGVAAGGGGGGDASAAASSDTQAPPAPADVRVLAQADGRILVTGSAEPGSTVTVRFPDGTDLSGAAQADGRFQVLSDAVQSSGDVSAQARDASGNTGPAATAAYADITPPAAPALAFQAHADGTATASGIAEAGARVEVRFPNQSVVAALADATGRYVASSGGVAGNGNGSAVARDAAGNESARTTAALSDDAPPSATASITGAQDNLAPITGALLSGAHTNDLTPLLQGNLAADLEAGAVLAVLRNGQQVGQAQVSGTRWTYQESVRADGPMTYTVQAMDAAGNRGAASASFMLNIDSTPPQARADILSLTDDVPLDVGDMRSGVVTNDRSPMLTGVLSGALNAGEQVLVFRDGSTTPWVAAVDGRTWSAPQDALRDGQAYVYHAQVVDAAGNTGALSKPFEFSVDTAAPTLRATIELARSQVVGAYLETKSGGTLYTDAVTFTGQLDAPLSPGEVLRVYRDGALLGGASTDGEFFVFSDLGLSDGVTYSYTLRAVDAAGNQGAPSAPFVLTIDLPGDEGNADPEGRTGVSGTLAGWPSGLLLDSDDLTEQALVQGDVMWVVSSASEPGAPVGPAYEHAAGSFPSSDLWVPWGVQEGLP